MEIYDTANRLAEEIKNSTEYKELKEARDKINQNPEKKKLLDEFYKLRQEIQIAEIKEQNNEKVDLDDKKVKVAKLYNMLMQNEDMKHYFDLEVRFNKIIYDVNKILGDVIKNVI